MDARTPSLRFSWQAVNSLRGFAGALFAITVCSGLSLYADRLILSKWIPLTEYGVYVVLATVLAGFSRLVTPLTLYFSPLMTTHVSKGNCRATRIGLRTFFDWVLVLLIPPLANFALFSEEILALWTGNRDMAVGTRKLAALLALGVLLQSACYPITTMLYAKKELSVLLKAAVAMAVLVPILLLLLIPGYGALGASTTLAGCAIANFIYILIVGSQALGANLFSLLRNMCFSLAVSFGLCFLGGTLIGTYGPLSLGLLFILSFTGNAILVVKLHRWTRINPQ